MLRNFPLPCSRFLTASVKTPKARGSTRVAVERILPIGHHTQQCKGLGDIFPRSEVLLVYFFLADHSLSPFPRLLKYIPRPLCYPCSSQTLLDRSYPRPFGCSPAQVAQFGCGFSFQVLCLTLHNNLIASLNFALLISC